MIIAINSITFLKQPGYDYFCDYLIKTAALQQAHRFIFIGNRAVAPDAVAAKNIVYVPSSPKANNTLMWKLWLDFTLPAIARKHKADMIIHIGGLCSLRTKIAQHIFVSDLSFINFPDFFSKRQQLFFKRSMPAFLSRANRIIAGSDFLAKEISRQYLVNAGRIYTFRLPVDDIFQPMGWEEKEAIKERYAGGKEYFLFNGEIHPGYNLLNLLKAFSFFKKRQKSNMQLIITAPPVSDNNHFMVSLGTYKYRKEVSVLMDLPAKERARITAAAYAFVYPCLYDGTAVFPLQAMQCGVPVIGGISGSLIELAGDAALYADPANFEDIARKMMFVFKDENERSELIKKATVVLQKHHENITEDQFWKYIAGSA